MNRRDRLDREIDKVVRSQNCSGCGACTLLHSGLTMTLDNAGFSRPTRVEGVVGDSSVGRSDAVKVFRLICPGRRVVAPRPAGATRHPTLGPIVSAWRTWASDPEIRHRGSSGGSITALVSWLTETGEESAFVTARARPVDPVTTESVQVQGRSQALVSAGSRYAPVATLSHPAAAPGSPTGLVLKPCEASARRRLSELRYPRRADSATPLLLSFFCAGTPSQLATKSLLSELGMPAATVRDLWYRGRGWPGRFTAVDGAGAQVSRSYQESWGEHLGKTAQWRCKICVDGVGESSDISAADLWDADAAGYPVFDDGAGVSALLARTERGHDVLLRAFAAGVLVGTPIEPDRIAQVQPLQTSRRRTLLGRLFGTVLGGRRVPVYRGFGLITLSAANPRETLRTARGAFSRVRPRRRRR